MNKLENYVGGHWVQGQGEGQLLLNAVTSEPVALAGSKGIDFSQALDYGRKVGNPALRKMTFHERGRMLKALATLLLDKKEKFYELSYSTGATRSDSWIDIEGGIGNLFTNASLRRKFPDLAYCSEGSPIPLSKDGNFIGHHLLIPKEGVAIHINAFNFPVWGMLEKCAVNWLAGMPAIVKPATITSYLAQAVAREIIDSGILPPGALQIICGSAGDLLDHTGPQDVVTFTGSASTGLLLKSNKNILQQNVPFNMEADSLNCIVLGEDVEPSMPEWDIFIKEIRKEMTAKTGQKCTAIRRIFVPAKYLDEVSTAISRSLAQTTIGNPRNDKVRMGALAGQSQRTEVREQVQKLLAVSQLIYGSLDGVELIDADKSAGAFLSPLLLLNKDPFSGQASHEVEAFGPVSTLMPYRSQEEVITLAKMGKGSLCSTIVTADREIAVNYVVSSGTHHGRILVLDRECARESTGHGSPLPMLVHGGPGRAGGGEEMGGIRGVKHYMQRVAIQGSPSGITAITKIYQQHAAGIIDTIHPFRKFFEELVVGEQILTAGRLITAADIDQFANLSGDHFYAHNRDTDFAGTMFEGQVAHGYLILSLAAGLFVDGRDKGPVLLNYGIDEMRFTMPVYPGDRIRVRFTCKEKTPLDKKEPEDSDKGIVKWLVEVLNENDEQVAIGTILTMVARKPVAK